MLHGFFTKRIIIFSSLLLVIIGIISGVWLYKSEPGTDSTIAETEVIIPMVSETQKIEKNKALRMAKERASDALLSSGTKKERALLLSKKADYLRINSEYNDALDIYERVIDLDQQDTYKKKAASIAFEARNFIKSIQWYTETLPSLSLQEKEELLMSMRYTGNKEFLSLLSEIDIPSHIKRAYEVSWTCETTYIECEKVIREYTFDYRPINALKKALDDFKNLKNTDATFKEALLISAFYQNKDYSTVIRLGSNLLSRKPDYKPILKIVGFSAYLTNQYERAENALKKYKSLDSKDPEVDFLLGLIYFERQDYKLSNLYFNNAVLGGYIPKNIVERKLAYNYGILGMSENMFQVLGYLVENPDVTELDITNALYLSLTEKRLDLANKWIKIGLEKSPDSADIQSLRAWYMRLTDNKEVGLAIADSVLTKNPNHVIALVQAGAIHAEKGEKDVAKTLLEKAALIDAGGIWSDTIELYLSGKND